MADNCYCSVQFQTGEELDEALMKAKTACDEAEKAVAARTAIENMQVTAEVLEAGTTPTVTKTVEDGSVKLTFGLVPGANGKDGRGVSSISGSANGSWVITYTDNTSEMISSDAYNALMAEVSGLYAQKVSLPMDSDSPITGTAGQFAVSDGAGGITWLSLVNYAEVGA